MHLRIALLLGAACLAFAPPSMAQDGPATDANKPGQEADGPAKDLRKTRAVVPAVQITATRAADAHVRHVRDLTALVPGLIVSTAANSTLTSVRLDGFGAAGDNFGLSPSAGVFIDGVLRPRNMFGLLDGDAIERIEVTKRPQGVLAGRGASSGMINVVTRRPSRDTGFRGQVTGGEHGLYEAGGSFNAAVGSAAAIEIGGLYMSRDGFLDVDTGGGPRTDRQDGDEETFGVRGRLLVEAYAGTSVDLSLDFGRREGQCCAAVTLVRSGGADVIDALTLVGSGVAPVANPFARVAWANRSTAGETDDMGLSLALSRELDILGGATVASRTSLRRAESINGADLDYTAADLLYRNPAEDDDFTRIDTFAQDLTLAGTAGAVDWLAGASYAGENVERNEATRVGLAYEAYLSVEVLRNINPLLGTSPTAPLFFSQASGRPFGTVFAGHAANDTYRQQSDSFAVFTANTWRASDAFDLSFGVRYTWDSKELESRFANPNGGLGCGSMIVNPAQVVAALVARGLTVAQASAAAPGVVDRGCAPWTNISHNGRETTQAGEDGDWSGHLEAVYAFNDNVTGFVSAARDFKAFGYNFDRVQSNNGLPGGGAGRIPVNDTSFGAEAVQSYEMGVRTTWLDGVLALDATLFHRRYSDLQLAAFNGLSRTIRSIPEAETVGVDASLAYTRGGFTLNAGATYADSRYGEDLLPGAELARLPGDRLSFAPEWSLTGAVAYAWMVTGDLEARASVGAKYTSSYNAGYDLDPLKAQDAYTLVDARLAIGRADGVWILEFWAKNLADAEYVETAFDAPLQTGGVNAFLGEPRTFGVTLRTAF